MMKMTFAALAATLALAACATPTPPPFSPAPTKAPEPTRALGVASPNPNAPTPTVKAPPATPAGIQLPSGERPLAKLAPAQRLNFRNTVPENALAPGKKYVATFKITDVGSIKVLLDPVAAPITVNNFVFLANQGYFDGTSFHRVLANFMAQGGDPSGTGTGGPGYRFQDEKNSRVFDRAGILAMANSGPNTNGSQFFITFAPTPHLNGLHTIFGDVVEGNELLGKLKLRDPNTNPNFAGSVIERVDIGEADAAAASALAVPTVVPKTATCRAVPDSFGETTKELEIAKDDHVFGNANAATTIVEFSDTQCPSCAAFHPVSKRLLSDYGDNLRIVYRHFPLTSIHDKAFTAAVALEAAHEQGKFGDMLDVMFARQPEWSGTPVTDAVKTLTALAKEAKLDTAAFEKSMTKPELAERVRRDMKTGDTLKLGSTPSVFLDGQPINPGAFSDAAVMTAQFKPYLTRRAGYRAYLAGKPATYAKPENAADGKSIYELTLKTSKGDILIDLDPAIAPVNVNSVVFLAQKGWYKGANVMLNDVNVNAVLLSDASGTGLGSPGYECDNELGTTPAKAWEEAGTVALLSTEGGGAGAQLFITYGAASRLAGQFTVVGKVTKGLDFVKALQVAEGDRKADSILAVDVRKK